jgi:hypothetical protein
MELGSRRRTAQMGTKTLDFSAPGSGVASRQKSIGAHQYVGWTTLEQIIHSEELGG